MRLKQGVVLKGHNPTGPPCSSEETVRAKVHEGSPGKRSETTGGSPILMH